MNTNGSHIVADDFIIDVLKHRRSTDGDSERVCGSGNLFVTNKVIIKADHVQEHRRKR